MSRRARASKPIRSIARDRSTSRCAGQLAAAMAAHGAGQLDAARVAYTAVLEQEPENFDALRLLGIVAVQLGQPDVGESLIRLALRIKPRSHEALGNLALSLREQGRPQEAEAALRTSLEIAPTYVDGLRNLATLCRTQGRAGEAIVLLARAAAAAPDHPIVRGNLGALLLEAGDAQAAWPHLARSARISLNDPSLHANLGRAGLETDRVDQAIEACERALRLDANHLPARVTLSALERVRGNFEVAERHARIALAAASADRGAMLNLATALVEMARYEECTEIFDRMLERDPCDAQAHSGRGVVALARGCPEEAWRDHAWRWRLPESVVPRPPALPEWKGEMLDGRTLYVWPEQGIGDEIVYASTLPELAHRVGDTVLGCEPRLVRLFARSFPSVRVVANDELPSVAARAREGDRQCSVVDLAPILRPSMASFPSRAGYLVADVARAAHWRAWLGALGTQPKIGISWRSQNRTRERRLASTELMQWAPVLGVEDVHFICLQYDECSAELATVSKAIPTPIHVPPQLDQRNELDDVSALMQGLDLVITVATAVSMLAGGIGTPTWQLSRGVDWYAMGRDRSPWQPSVRRVYRRWDATWEEVLSGVASELQAFAAGAREQH